MVAVTQDGDTRPDAGLKHRPTTRTRGRSVARADKAGSSQNSKVCQVFAVMQACVVRGFRARLGAETVGSSPKIDLLPKVFAARLWPSG